MRYDEFDIDDRDAPQQIDLDRDSDDETIDCPSCGRAIHEEAPRCPYCGEWLFGDTASSRRSRGWFWPVMAAILVAVILVMWHRLGG